MRVALLAFASLTTCLVVASCTAEDAITFRIVDSLKLAPPECLGAVAQARDEGRTLVPAGADFCLRGQDEALTCALE